MDNLITPDLINHCKQFNAIVICGFTKTGKIKIAKTLSESLNMKLFMSDDYLYTNHVDALYHLINDILPYYNNKIPIIVEGTQCFRLLRKGLQEKNFYPDLIIRTECNEATIRLCYNNDGEGHKIDKALIFNKGLNTTWNNYKELLKIEIDNNPNFKPPQYIEINTSII